jgi:tetratricopeptide (TPR) repeat protein
MRIGYFILFLLMLGGTEGCSTGGDGDGGPLTADSLVARGWRAYTAKDYNTAKRDFLQAVSLDGSVSDAYNGAGWTFAVLGVPDTALINFTKGRSRDSANLEMHAGIAFVYNALKLYDLSILHDTAVIRVNPNWIFSHDNTMNVLDLHLLAAEDYFAMGNFTASLSEVQLYLNSSFSADVTTISGQILLAKEIERLRSIV